MYWLVRPLLFLLGPETAHRFAFAMLRLCSVLPLLGAWLRRRLRPRDPRLSVTAFGKTFSSPIGLAAGFDKNAEGFNALSDLGFGFIEVGTVTAEPQPGNPKPRLFRLPRDRALINRMGFNNHGAKAVAPRLIGLRRTIVGVNIGKTRRVREDAAVADYQSTARALVPHADFLVVNVSSPNTSGLRNLQAVDKLRPLLVAIKSVMIQTCADAPLLVKIAPDTSDEEIDAICDLALELGLDGIVATNTTVSRRGLRTDPERIRNIGDGGVSGAPLGARALSVLRRIHSRTGARLCIISVGGIETARDVWERLQSGATLVQLYSSLIYEGPGLVAKIHAGLLEHLEREGIDSIKQVVGRHAASRDSESSPRRGTGPVSTSARA